jgi:hypothetical protein
MRTRHRAIAVVTAVGAALLLPATGHGAIRELGLTSKETVPPKPSCPGTAPDFNDCQMITRTTAYQLKVGSDRNLFVVPKNGRIVAWTIRLAKPNSDEISFFSDSGKTATGKDKAALGVPSAGITVLRPGKKHKSYSRAVASSPIVDLSPYYGKTVQFPLAKSLPANKGRIIALNVPSWAPALQIGQPNTTSWHGARPTGKCGISTNTVDNSYQLFLDSYIRLGKIGNLACLYQGTRVTFSVTMITNPSPAPKTVGGSSVTTPIASKR